MNEIQIIFINSGFLQRFCEAKMVHSIYKPCNYFNIVIMPTTI